MNQKFGAVIEGNVMERPSRSIFAGSIGITLAVIILITVIVSARESTCQTKFDTNRPIYPDATLVSEESKFLQYRQAKYVSTSAAGDIKEWYNKIINVAIRESIAKNGTRGNVWDGQWEIEASDKGGSTITLSRNCT